MYFMYYRVEEVKKGRSIEGLSTLILLFGSFFLTPFHAIVALLTGIAVRFKALRNTEWNNPDNTTQVKQLVNSINPTANKSIKRIYQKILFILKPNATFLAIISNRYPLWTVHQEYIWTSLRVVQQKTDKIKLLLESIIKYFVYKP